MEAGERPVFLTRGHGGGNSGPHIVDPENDTARQVGDEALLLAQSAPTIVSRDRREGAKTCETLNASVIIMDDGFQNPSLRKDISLLAVDRSLGIGNGLIIPAGPLRASVSSQLARAQGLILIGEGAAGDDIAARMHGRSKPVYYGHVEPAENTDWLSGRNIIAFAGIGYPEKFFLTLEHTGAKLTKRFSFPDHHTFSEMDATRLLAASEQAKASLVTTQKDLVRLPRGGAIFEKLRAETRALPVWLELQDAMTVQKLLLDGIAAKKPEALDYSSD